jgi:hypothetical protein
MARLAQLLAVWLLPPLIVFSADAVAQRTASEGATAVTRESLLTEAHGLASGLPSADKAEVLERIVDVVQPGSPASEPWIDELFALGADLGEMDRDGPEAAAAEAMARIAPAKALQMLDRIQEPHLKPEQPYRDARAEAAAAVFTAAYLRLGTGILPDLRARAQRMGATGQYPYLAWARLSGYLQRNATDPEFFRTVFDDSVSAYLGSVPNGPAENDFRQFMAQTCRTVPYDVAHVAMEKTVVRLRAQAAEKTQGTKALRIFTGKGEATFSNPGQVRLLLFLNVVVARMDPEFASALRKSDPALNQPALQYDPGLDAFVPDEVTGGDTRSLPSVPVQRSEAMVRAEYLSHKDVSAAIAYGKGIGDPLTRSEVFGAIIIGAAAPGSHVDTALAADLAKSLVSLAKESAEQVADPPGQLLAFGHLAQAAAAANEQETLLWAVNLGFPIGSKLLNDAKARGSTPRSVVVFWLRSMVAELARTDPQSALDNTRKITDAKLRALLLTEVAARWKDQ